MKNETTKSGASNDTPQFEKDASLVRKILTISSDGRVLVY